MKHIRESAALIILPSVALGVLAMIVGGVSPALWGQQAAAWLVLGLLAFALRRAAARIPDAVWSAALLLFLALSLLGQEVGGARRWVNLIVFHAHAAMLVLPALLVVLGRANMPYPALLASAAVLCVQPDMTQLAAFSAAALPVLWRRRGNLRFACAAALAGMIILCLQRPVQIEPVPYCEGILTMLRERSALLAAAGVIALWAVPARWAFGFLAQRRTYMLSLAVYYAVWMLLSASGHCPVPLMGFGLSPIAGYYLAHFAAAPQEYGEKREEAEN